MTENGEKTSSSSSSVSPAVLEILSSILPGPESESDVKPRTIDNSSSRSFQKLTDHGESSTENEEGNKETPSACPGPSHRPSTSFPNLIERNNDREYHVYRAIGVEPLNSLSGLSTQVYSKPQVPSNTATKILPSYSSVLKLGPPKPREVRLLPSVSFVSRQPPPSYAEVQGIWQDSTSIISSDSRIFGPDPSYMVCPRCRTIVITDVERQRSVWTYLASMLMCLFCCWPCCLLPYWTDTFQYSYHSCPNCRHYFGMYRPC